MSMRKFKSHLHHFWLRTRILSSSRRFWSLKLILNTLEQLSSFCHWFIGLFNLFLIPQAYFRPFRTLFDSGNIFELFWVLYFGIQTSFRLIWSTWHLNLACDTDFTSFSSSFWLLRLIFGSLDWFLALADLL